MRIILLIFFMLFFSCNNKGKDSVEKADSVNQARLERGLNQNQVVIDENSSAFLVRAAALSMQLKMLSGNLNATATTPAYKTLGAKLVADYKSLNDSIVALAIRKNIVLPEDTSDVQTALKRNIISLLVEAEEIAISLFDNAILDTKDPDIRSFADKTIPLLKKNLESAKKLHKVL